MKERRSMSLPSALMTLRPFLRRIISGESQHPQPARQARRQRRRLSGHLSPGGFARQGQGGELAALQKPSLPSCCVCTGRRMGRSRSLTVLGSRRRLGTLTFERQLADSSVIRAPKSARVLPRKAVLSIERVGFGKPKRKSRFS
jgi:hypothetical protein